MSILTEQPSTANDQHRHPTGPDQQRLCLKPFASGQIHGPHARAEDPYAHRKTPSGEDSNSGRARVDQPGNGLQGPGTFSDKTLRRAKSLDPSLGDQGQRFFRLKMSGGEEGKETISDRFKEEDATLSSS